jgi:AcrR family transcriptional regulator
MSTRAQHRLDTRAAIFDAAVTLIEAQGYEQTSVEEICSAAGVGRATFFRHFETKAGLLREYNRRLAEDATQRIATLASTDATSRLQAVADAIHDAWVAAGPGLRRLGADAATLADPSGNRTELLALVLDVVRAGRAAGELATDLPPPLTAYLIVTHLAGATAWWFNHPDDDLHQLLDSALAQSLYGIAATTPHTTNGARPRSNLKPKQPARRTAEP